jgi:adenosylmethionine-8-amino-7-oxononanoate aminotransferase
MGGNDKRGIGRRALVRDICIAKGLMARGTRDCLVMSPPLAASQKSTGWWRPSARC